MRLVVILLIAFSLACSNSKKAVEESSSKEVVTEVSTALTFERTLCFGACPAFKITVMSDGSCAYEGYKFVDMVGKYKATISQEKLSEIQQEAANIDFFNLRDTYDNQAITDIPSVIIAISGENGMKQIVDRAEAPEELKRFEKYLDQVLLSLDWQKAE